MAAWRGVRSQQHLGSDLATGGGVGGRSLCLSVESGRGKAVGGSSGRSTTHGSGGNNREIVDGVGAGWCVYGRRSHGDGPLEFLACVVELNGVGVGFYFKGYGLEYEKRDVRPGDVMEGVGWLHVLVGIGRNKNGYKFHFSMAASFAWQLSVALSLISCTGDFETYGISNMQPKII